MFLYYNVAMSHKLLYLTRATFIASIQYRAEIIIWVVLDFVPPLVLLAIWGAIFSGRSEIKGYTFTSMALYYVSVFIINSICAAHFSDWRARDVREGKIDLALVKPISYLATVFFHHTGGKLFYYLFATIPFLLVCLAAARILGIEIQLTWQQLAGFMFLLTADYLIHFFLGFCIVLSSFWLEQADSMNHFVSILLTVLSGMMLPITLMPNWLAAIVSALPFKYLYATPLAILQQNYVLSLGDVLYVCMSVLGLYLLSQLLWQQGRKIYGSAGG